MTAERKAELKELQGLVNTAYTAVGKVIEVIYTKRECKTPLTITGRRAWATYVRQRTPSRTLKICYA